MASLYQNAYYILDVLRECHPVGLPGYELRGQRMSDTDFSAAFEYLKTRKAVESNAIPLPVINRHYNLINLSTVEPITSPADLLEQDLIVCLAEFVGRTLDPYKLGPPITQDQTLLEMVIRRLIKRDLLKAIESEDVTTGRSIFSSIFVPPDILEAKLELDYGIQQSPISKGIVVQHIQIAEGNSNVQISGNKNKVTNTAKQVIDVGLALQALEHFLALLDASPGQQDQKDLARTDAANLKAELQRESPGVGRLQTFWITLMTTIQGLAAIPGLIEAATKLGRSIGAN